MSSERADSRRRRLLCAVGSATGAGSVQPADRQLGAAVGCPEHWLHQCRDKQHIQQLVSADRQSEQLQPELADDDGRRVRVCADADFADERCAGHQANQGRPEEALLPFCRSPQESRFEHDQRDGPGADSNGARSVSKHAQRSRHRNRLGSGQG